VRILNSHATVKATILRQDHWNENFGKMRVSGLKL